jgi:dTDP-N-acetylfucosamine:lipid II N-acetylfucosaminyltransferase
MHAGKVLHVMHTEKFIEPFIEFVEHNFDDFQNRHVFFVWGDITKFRIKSRFNLKSASKRKIDQLKYFFYMVFAIQKAEKVILHGLFVQWHLILLSMMPWNLKKCYWVIWGGDLYTYKLSKRSLGWWRIELFRRFVIKRIGHFITHIEGDYRLAQQWYGAKGEWSECFMYPSNLYQEANTQLSLHKGISILLGNSADPSNNHLEVLNNLKSYAVEDIKIYCPLSYGDQLHAKIVSDYGQTLFGEKFIPLRHFMTLEKYNELLAKVDIAIFNHNRQQGMGNTTTLLGMGKKVFIRQEVTPYMMFKNFGVKVYSINNLDLNKIDPGVAMANSLAIKNYFSTDRLKEQWRVIYE